jgi:threonine synthase
VPTGNFGDVFAGYVAAKMGLPVAKLIVATNVNDILHRALTSGDYAAGMVTPTATPSMDIQVSSNFERLLFDLSGRNGDVLGAMMRGFEAERGMKIPADMIAAAKPLFTSARIDGDAMAMAMRWAQQNAGHVIDPHSAIGLAAARAAAVPADVPIITLATAHPAKFPDAVERATGVRPSLPSRLGGLFDRAEQFDILPATADAIKAYVEARGTQSAA